MDHPEASLLNIHLAIKEIQVVQKQILDKIDEDKVYKKEVDDRLTKMENQWTYLLGAAAPLGVGFYFILDWVKFKLGIST